MLAISHEHSYTPQSEVRHVAGEAAHDASSFGGPCWDCQLVALPGRCSGRQRQAGKNVGITGYRVSGKHVVPLHASRYFEAAQSTAGQGSGLIVLFL